MANELENTIRSVVEKIAQYVADAATLTVETRYVRIGTEASVTFSDAQPAAHTTIKLDADCSAIIPMRADDAGSLAVDTALLQIHQANVATAIEYRARILSALLVALQQLGTRR